MSTYDVIQEVYAERREQAQREGYTADHDDKHATGDLAKLASVYALRSTGEYDGDQLEVIFGEPATWSKAHPRRRCLVIAAALALAEIERLDRAAAKQR